MRVKSVKRVSVAPTKVYDLTVEGTENFKLTAGPVVHNSKDVSDALAGVNFGLFTRREIWMQFDVEPSTSVLDLIKTQPKTTEAPPPMPDFPTY